MVRSPTTPTAPGSSINISKPYIPQPMSSDVRYSMFEGDEDVIVDFDFELEMNGSDAD